MTTQDTWTDESGRTAWTWLPVGAGHWYVRAVANPTPFNANSVWSQLERYFAT